MRSIRSPQIHLAGLLGMLALFGAGCGGGGHTNSGTAGDAYASFAWSIYDIEDTTFRSPLSCAAVGASNVAVTLTNQQTGSIYGPNTVSCSSSNMEMSTAYVPAGDYAVGFDLYGDPTIYGNASTLLDSFDGTGTFHLYPGLNDFRSPDAAFITQSLVVGWGVYSQGVLSACSYVGAKSVDLDFQVPGSSARITSTFDCNQGSGISFPIPYGATSAQWQMYAVDFSGQDIASVAGGTVPVPSNADVHLGTQYFSF
jgi:hypothetical protein